MIYVVTNATKDISFRVRLRVVYLCSAYICWYLIVWEWDHDTDVSWSDI